MNKHSLAARLRYEFDKSMSAGPIALIGWLAVLSVIVIVVAGAVIAVLRITPEGGEALSFVEAMWASLMRTLDAGTMGGDTGWTFRIVMLLVTIGGIFIVSILIGTITSGLESRLDELRKGRSRVIERDHVLILGWSSKIHSIIGELLIANRNQRKPRIVILADRDKVGMEDDIRAKFPDLGNTRVICRSGDPLDLDDLAVVDPHGARAIVLLAPEIENPDIYVIKSVLAITNNPDRRAGRYHRALVACVPVALGPAQHAVARTRHQRRHARPRGRRHPGFCDCAARICQRPHGSQVGPRHRGDGDVRRTRHVRRACAHPGHPPRVCIRPDRPRSRTGQRHPHGGAPRAHRTRPLVRRVPHGLL